MDAIWHNFVKKISFKTKCKPNNRTSQWQARRSAWCYIPSKRRYFSVKSLENTSINTLESELRKHLCFYKTGFRWNPLRNCVLRKLFGRALTWQNALKVSSWLFALNMLHLSMSVLNSVSEPVQFDGGWHCRDPAEHEMGEGWLSWDVHMKKIMMHDKLNQSTRMHACAHYFKLGLQDC